MGVRSDIAAHEEWFNGEVEKLRFRVMHRVGNPVDPNGWALRFVAGLKAPLVVKTTGGGGITVIGVYHATLALNTQWVVVDLTDAESELLSGESKTYTLRRTDVGSKALLAYGDLVLRRVA